MRMWKIIGLLALVVCAASLPAVAEQINFTGGTAYLWNGTTYTPNNSGYVEGVGSYVEGNYTVTFTTASETMPFSTIIGDYYGIGNDVIHGHWAGGGFGDLTRITFSRTDGALFSLNYFVLTTNTQVGGDGATGFEQAWIHASTDGTTSSYQELLPSQSWGTQDGFTAIYLGGKFQNIKSFWFDVTNPVACFGMDSFYIDEPAPPAPEPATFVLLAMGAGVLKYRVKKLLRR